MTRTYTIEVHRVLGAMDIDHDWCAYDDKTYCGEPTDPIGYGATPADAIVDLIWRIEEMCEELAPHKKIETTGK